MKGIKLFERFKKQNGSTVLTSLAKLLLGIGAGFLLTVYLQGYDWNFYGWALIIVSLILYLPVVYTRSSKK